MKFRLQCTYTEYGKKFDILYSGTGLKHFLDVLLKTTISQADIVLLDEPEMGLHPDLQRRFLDYLNRLTKEKGIQFFLATQSQVLLNYANITTFYRVTNIKGAREVKPVPNDAIHTLLGDLGIRPSDVFNQDICLLVEGASEVVYFEHIIRTLYKDEFDKIAVGIQQYGGSAAEGILSGSIDVSNITPAQNYILWTHDRDASKVAAPSIQATKFKNAIEKLGFKCHIWNRREIEFYYPEAVHIAAQQGDKTKEETTCNILNGDQEIKYKTAAKGTGVCVPFGVYLRKLLAQHLTNKSQLPPEIRSLVESTLLPWKREILGQ
jgi:hypothetical protein